MSDFKYFVNYGGGIGPDVWDKDIEIHAVDIEDAIKQAKGIAEESGGWVFQVLQADYESTRDQLETKVQELRMENAEAVSERDAALAELATAREERDGARVQRDKADCDRGSWTGRKCNSCLGTGEGHHDRPCSSCGGTGDEWWTYKDQLERSLSSHTALLATVEKMRKALQSQHDWHLDQIDRSPVYFGDTIGQVNAEEYKDSELCEKTAAALSTPAPLADTLRGVREALEWLISEHYKHPATNNEMTAKALTALAALKESTG